MTLRYVLNTTLIPQSWRICDVTDFKSEIQFICPQGRGFSIVLGVPAEMGKDKTAFEGEAVIVISEFARLTMWFNSTNVSTCNWLDDSRLQGYVLSWPIGAADLGSILRPSSKYRMILHFKRVPPQPASVWLHYFQNRREIWQERTKRWDGRTVGERTTP
jgi:hypothetical protein